MTDEERAEAVVEAMQDHCCTLCRRRSPDVQPRTKFRTVPDKQPMYICQPCIKTLMEYQQAATLGRLKYDNE